MIPALNLKGTALNVSATYKKDLDVKKRFRIFGF